MRATGVTSKDLACHDCDALFSAPVMREGERVICPRCGASLFVNRPDSLQRSSAYVVASAVLFFVANLFPFMTLKQEYRSNQMVLVESVTGLWNQPDYAPLAVLIAIFMLVAPALLILGLMYLLIPLIQHRVLPGSVALCRLITTARRWQMLDVYLLGCLVSLLKLGKLATLNLGTSFWAFAALIISLSMALGSIDLRELWARIEVARR